MDDHPLFRKGIKPLIAHHCLFKVVGEVRNGHEGLEKALSLRPDLLVIDLSLPDQSGIEVTRKIRSLLIDTRIMILSMHSNIDHIAEAFLRPP